MATRSYPARDAILKAAEDLIPLNPEKAVVLSQLLQLTDSYTADYQELQRKFDATDPSQRLTDPELQNLNKKLYDEAFEIGSLAFKIAGASKAFVEISGLIGGEL